MNTDKTSWTTRIAISLILLGGLGLSWWIVQSPAPRANATPEHGHSHNEAGHSEAGHSEAEHSEAGHSEAGHSDAGHSEAGHSEAGHSEAGHSEAGHAESQAWTDTQLQQYGIKLAAATGGTLRQTLDLPAQIQLNADLTLNIVPRLSGRIERAPVSAGDKVKSGQLLAELSSQEVAEQRSQWLAARQQLQLAQAQYQREQTLWRQQISAEQDYLAAKHGWQQAQLALTLAEQKLSSLGLSTKTSDQSLTRYPVYSPIEAVVLNKNLRLGQVVNAETPIFQIADLRKLWVETEVPADQLAALKLGDTASLTYGQRRQSLRLILIGHQVNPQNLRAKIRFELDNSDGHWQPGLAVRLQLTTAELPLALSIPLTALQTIDGQSVVFVRSGTKLEPRVLSLGRRDAQQVEVLSGLALGERYVTDNSFLVKADIEKAGASHEH